MMKYLFSLPAVYRYTQDDFFGSYYYGLFPYITPWVYAFGLIAQTGSIYCTLGVNIYKDSFVTDIEVE